MEIGLHCNSASGPRCLSKFPNQIQAWVTKGKDRYQHVTGFRDKIHYDGQLQFRKAAQLLAKFIFSYTSSQYVTRVQFPHTVHILSMQKQNMRAALLDLVKKSAWSSVLFPIKLVQI